MITSLYLLKNVIQFQVNQY